MQEIPAVISIILKDISIEFRTIRTHMVDIWNKIENQGYQHIHLGNEFRGTLHKMEQKLASIDTMIQKIGAALNVEIEDSGGEDKPPQ